MPNQDIALAYDSIAGDYNEQQRFDTWVREILWDEYTRAFRPDMVVLDAGCGTGTDSLFLARRGIYVTAIDISPIMLTHLEAAAALEGLESMVTTKLMDFGDLEAMPAISCDGLVSGYAAVNSAPDLARFGEHSARLVRPGGTAIIHALNPFNVWEWMGFVARRRWAEARRLGRSRERIAKIGGRPILHHVLPLSVLYDQAFSPYFTLQRAYAVGVLRPVYPLRWVPPLVAFALGGAEQLVRRWPPFRDRGLFYVLVMKRREGVNP